MGNCACLGTYKRFVYTKLDILEIEQAVENKARQSKEKSETRLLNGNRKMYLPKGRRCSS